MTRRLASASIAAATLVAFGLLAVGCRSTPSPSHEGDHAAAPVSWSKSPVTGQSATLLVKGLSCPLCATNVDLQLKRLPGVDSVDIDFDSGRIFVGFKGERRPTQRQLADAVADAGFTLAAIN